MNTNMTGLRCSLKVFVLWMKEASALEGLIMGCAALFRKLSLTYLNVVLVGSIEYFMKLYLRLIRLSLYFLLFNTVG